MEVFHINSNIYLNKDSVVDSVVDNDIWSDEEQGDDDATLLDNFVALFNINTYIYNEDPIKKINKKLGSIIFNNQNKKYKAQYSTTYPKIVYNNELFDNLHEWIKYIKKNDIKNKLMFDFLQL